MRLRLVLTAKLLGFSLTEAKQIIDVYHQPNGARKQLEVALQRMAEQKVVLQDQRREIDQSLEAMEVAWTSSASVSRRCWTTNSGVAAGRGSSRQSCR